MPPSPPDLSTVPGGALGRALVRWLDPDRPRRLAERRVGRAVQVAVPLHVRRGLGRPGRRLLVALADDTVYLLAFRDARPLGMSVGGAIAALPRDELAAHFRTRLGRAVRAELSWPHRQTFVAGDLPPGAATDELVGLVAADELGRLTT